MTKLLYIKANPQPNDKSISFKMSKAFVEEYIKANPEAEITTLDLYKEGIKFLDEKMIDDVFSGKETEMLRYAKQFAEADRYVIAAPMWNLASPAILKAYFDYVVMVGVTFKYTEQGPVGLLAGKGKKAVHIVARGGMYTEGPGANYEMGDRYIKTILPFIGIESVNTISSELTNVLQGEELQASINKSIEDAGRQGKEF
jgi:FMN-dependent NADH-azoreductase